MWTLPSCARRVIRAHSLQTLHVLAPESLREYPARTSLVSPLHTGGVVSRHARATLTSHSFHIKTYNENSKRESGEEATQGYKHASVSTCSVDSAVL